MSASPGPHGPNNLMTDSDPVVADRLVGLHGETHGPTRRQWLDLLASPDRGPVLVVYQVEFHEFAVRTDESLEVVPGKVAFLKAGAAILPAVIDAGGQPLLGADVVAVAGVEPDGQWDYFGAARYPDRAAIVQLWLDERFLAAEPERQAATKRHRIWFTKPLW